MGGGVFSDVSDFEYLALEVCNMSPDFLFLLLHVDALTLEPGGSIDST